MVGIAEKTKEARLRTYKQVIWNEDINRCRMLDIAENVGTRHKTARGGTKDPGTSLPEALYHGMKRSEAVGW